MTSRFGGLGRCLGGHGKYVLGRLGEMEVDCVAGRGQEFYWGQIRIERPLRTLFKHGIGVKSGRHSDKVYMSAIVQSCYLMLRIRQDHEKETVDVESQKIPMPNPGALQPLEFS